VPRSFAVQPEPSHHSIFDRDRAQHIEAKRYFPRASEPYWDMTVFDFAALGVRPLDLENAMPRGGFVEMVADGNLPISLDRCWQG
jgi:hypothetical protein